MQKKILFVIFIVVLSIGILKAINLTSKINLTKDLSLLDIETFDANLQKSGLTKQQRTDFYREIIKQHPFLEKKFKSLNLLNKNRTTIILPCFNEELTIEKVLKEYLEEFSRPTDNVNFILVSDGSKDKTPEILQRLCDESTQQRQIVKKEFTGPYQTIYSGTIYFGEKITVVLLNQQTWKVGAVDLAFQLTQRSDSDIVGFVDTDDTIPPTEYRKLIEAVEQGKDLALGSRTMDASMHLNEPFDLNQCLNSYRVTNVLSRALFDSPWQDTESGAKVLSARARDLWVQTHTCSNLFFDAEMMHILKTAGFELTEIPIRFKINDKDNRDTGSILTKPIEIIGVLSKHFTRVAEKLKETREKVDQGLRAINLTIVLLSYDGITTFQCGVGKVILDNIKIIQKFNEMFKGILKIKLYLLTPDYKKLTSYSEEIKAKNTAISQQTGGDLIEITTKHPFKTEFGMPVNWVEVSKKSARIIRNIIQSNVRTLVIAHDTAFAQVPYFISLMNLQNYFALWVPHSTSAVYDGVGAWPERFEWERHAFVEAKHRGYKIGYIGSFIKRDFSTHYTDGDESSFIPFQTGIILQDYFKDFTDEEFEQEFAKFGIPLDKKLIFTIGRACPMKGQDIAVEIFNELYKERQDIHLVMLAPDSRETFGNSEYLTNVKKRIKELGIKQAITVIDDFDSVLPAYMYGWKNTFLVLSMSRWDFKPLIPMEARAASKNAVILTSNLGGFPEQITDGVDGFLVDLKEVDVKKDKIGILTNLKEMAKKAMHILNLTYLERQSIVLRGKIKILEKYDFTYNFFEFLKRCFPTHILMDYFLKSELKTREIFKSLIEQKNILAAL